MTVREDRDAALDRADAGDDAIGARGDVPRALAAGTAVPEEHPPRRRPADVRRRAPLVVAVVPLHEVRIDLSRRAETRQVARLPRATERTREDGLERDARQERRQPADLPAAVLRERRVRTPGVPSGEAPLSLAVSDEEHITAGRTRLHVCRHGTLLPAGRAASR